MTFQHFLTAAIDDCRECFGRNSGKSATISIRARKSRYIIGNTYRFDVHLSDPTVFAGRVKRFRVFGHGQIVNNLIVVHDVHYAFFGVQVELTDAVFGVGR